MASLTSLEEQVLGEIHEDLTSPEVWDGDDELREALGDGIDECCFFTSLFTDRLIVPLKKNVMFYSLSAMSSYPLFIRRAYLREQERELECTSLVSIVKRDSHFMLGRSSPREYVPLSPSLIMVYPCYSTDGGSVELDVVATPKHYSLSTDFLTTREELEDALVHYGKYYLLLRGGMTELALEEYGLFLKALGAQKQFAHHHREMARFRYKAQGEA